MGMLLALYWSLPSVKTNSVASAYFFPFRGLDGAGDGGRLCPSRSVWERAFGIDVGGLLPKPEGGPDAMVAFLVGWMSSDRVFSILDPGVLDSLLRSRHRHVNSTAVRRTSGIAFT